MNKTYYLSTRIQRLLASIIDGLSLLVVVLPLIYFIETPSTNDNILDLLLYGLFINIVGIAFFLLINYKFLVNDGQTIGKKILKIKIVNLEGEVPSKKSLLMRYGTYFLLQNIPFIGNFLNLLNILFIFGKEKRCGHDYIAKTVVIKSNI